MLTLHVMTAGKKGAATGQGRSKKEAEQAAAKAAVLEMEKKHG